MKYSLCEDFLNSKKVIYPLGKYLYSYINGKRNFYPWSVEIHPTAKCNHRCIHCSYKERNEGRAEISIEVFEPLIDDLIKMKVKGVYFSGGGEPCTYKALPEAISKLNDNGVEVALISNGSLIERQGVLDVADRLNYIALSVPSCDAGMFEKITGKPYVEEVLKLPNKIMKRFGQEAPIVGARVVVTNFIAEEVPHILKRLRKENFDYALFKVVRDYEDRGLGLDEAAVVKLKKEVKELMDQGEIDHSFTNLDKLFNYRKKYNNSGICHINNMGLLAAITPEGDVYSNISEIGHEKFLIGNLHETSLIKLWNSSQHQTVKKISNETWCDGKCKNCRAISYNEKIESILSGIPKEDPFL